MTQPSHSVCSLWFDGAINHQQGSSCKVPIIDIKIQNCAYAIIAKTNLVDTESHLTDLETLPIDSTDLDDENFSQTAQSIQIETQCVSSIQLSARESKPYIKTIGTTKKRHCVVLQQKPIEIQHLDTYQPDHLYRIQVSLIGDKMKASVTDAGIFTEESL